MLNKNLIGFTCEKEFLPKDFDEFNSLIRLRQMFLNLSNNILQSYCNFSKYEQRKLSFFSLEKAFSYKITTYASSTPEADDPFSSTRFFTASVSISSSCSATRPR